jgi:hypothetical protein
MKRKNKKGKGKKRKEKEKEKKKKKKTYGRTYLTLPEIPCRAGSARSLVHACRPRVGLVQARRTGRSRAGAIRHTAFVWPFGAEESRGMRPHHRRKKEEDERKAKKVNSQPLLSPKIILANIL